VIDKRQSVIEGELKWTRILTLAQRIQTTIAPSFELARQAILDAESFSAKSLSLANPDRAHTKRMFCF
jgi:hypothetical protein